ncbi:MAG TPA: ABC transporter permease [Fimbriimonadaceae bacterium]|nr:ABC transporter permease [Fimbriimonadaceae bacterium]
MLLVVVCAITELKSPAFLGIENLQNTARLIGMYGIFSIGVGLVIITGGIDLSVGSMFALLGVFLAMILDKTENNWPWPLGWMDKRYWPWPFAIIATLGLGTAIGSLHGFLVTRVKLQPFIVTLCGLLFYRGIARYIASDDAKGFEDATGFHALQDFATGKVYGVPMPFVILIVLSIVMWVVLHRSVYGRHLFAVGRNEETARFSGINTKRVIASAYILSGFLAGVAAILIAFYTNSISPAMHGNFYELYGIAAAVLGGCSLRGGEGSIVGIILGTALLQVLQNLVNLLGIPSSLNFAVMGAVIILGALADQLLINRSAARRATA